MEMNAAQFESLKMENIGQGVIEFEISGVFYDAYRVKHAKGMVSLLVKKDHLDSALAHSWKQCKRFLAKKGTTVPYGIFNFYFPATAYTILEGWTQVQTLFRAFWESYSYLFSFHIHCPPWVTG